MKCEMRSEPWLTEGAIEFLTHFVQPGFRVLEIGGGASTVWFAKKGCYVITYDQDNNWIKVIKSLLGVNLPKVELHHITTNYLGGSDTTDLICRLGELHPPESFDLVLIDAGLHEERQGGCQSAIPLIKPGGVLMADNADSGWVVVAEVHKLIPCWNYTISTQRRPDKFGFSADGWHTAWWQKPPMTTELGVVFEGEY